MSTRSSSKPHASPRRRTAPKTSRRWSKHVMETSDALDLRRELFKQTSARGIALSLKRSAERSQRRKAEPFRSAMSMLNFYINRAGKNLSPERKRVLGRAKVELRKVFHREPPC
jgi:type IV secretory pathway VirB10-like protein